MWLSGTGALARGLRMTKSRSARIYTVVDVMSGVTVGVENFLNPKSATVCLRRLRKASNLDEDDVQLFESVVQQPALHQHAKRKTSRKS